MSDLDHKSDLPGDGTDATLLADPSLLESLFEYAPDAILLVDQVGRIRRVNAQVEAIFGHARGALLGAPIETLVPRAARSRHVGHREAYAAAPHARPMGSGAELQGQRADGSVFPVEVALGPVAHSGEPWMLAVVRDVTARKQTEDALRIAREKEAQEHRLVEEQTLLIQAEKLSSIGLLAAGVAHEINNPLSGVLACVKALRTNRVPEERRAEYFDTAQDGLERIRATVRNLLDYARPSRNSPDAVDVPDAVHSSARLCRAVSEAHRVAIEVTVQADMPAARGDRSQIVQVLLNLLLNACQASVAGGVVEIDVHVAGPSALELVVSDRGVGIASDDLPRIFEPFYSTKPRGEGTGLGLTVTAELVRRLGGELHVESALGDGTRVIVRLPRYDHDPRRQDLHQDTRRAAPHASRLGIVK